ncbi:MAG: hypothetical protein SFV51_20075 [Bryobacteraceae bacterium]|nr:hypothetical protein [Bryobacteraceae bacterium]
MRLLLILIGGFGGGLAWAQSDPPLSVKEKAALHLKRALYPTSIGKDIVQGAILHWADSPTEWGQGWGPFGYRVAGRAGGDLTRQTMQFAINSAFRHDPRYVRLPEGSTGARISNALRQMFVVRADDGTWKPAIARWGSAVGTAAVSRQWLPKRVGAFDDTAIRFGLSLSGDLAFNLASEFLPDLKRRIFKRRQAPSSSSSGRKTGSIP